MLYAVTLTYLKPVDEVNLHLSTHQAWLAEHARAGRILTAGPLEPRTGGMLIAHCASRDELDRLLEQDSFHVHGLAAYEVRAFHPVLRAPAFPLAWAPEARAA